jgi:hypothetical protein
MSGKDCSYLVPSLWSVFSLTCYLEQSYPWNVRWYLFLHAFDMIWTAVLLAAIMFLRTPLCSFLPALTLYKFFVLFVQWHLCCGSSMVSDCCSRNSIWLIEKGCLRLNVVVLARCVELVQSCHSGFGTGWNGISRFLKYTCTHDNMEENAHYNLYNLKHFNYGAQ